MTKKLLWVGDACVATGFAQSTHHLLDALDFRCAPAGTPWETIVVGVNHFGDPLHGYPYAVYPAILAGDPMGVRCLPNVVKIHRPAVIVVQADPWNIADYVKAIRSVDSNVPIVGIIAIDGKNCQATCLNDLAFCVFWTQFAEDEARLGGYLGPSAVIPLGVDRSIFHPVPRAEARGKYRPGPDAKIRPGWEHGFLIGVINRNQDRKRFDLTVDYFCDWVETRNVQDAFLAMQACPTSEEHLDVRQLMAYRGHEDRLLYVQPPIGQGYPPAFVNFFYNMLDVVLSTSQGEGFGLTTLEAMATGRACIVSDWAAQGEWPGEAAIRVFCSTTYVNQFNVYGGVMDRDLALTSLDILYKDTAYRERLEAKALALACEDRFDWRTVGRRFSEVVDSVVEDGIAYAPPDVAQTSAS